MSRLKTNPKSYLVEFSKLPVSMQRTSDDVERQSKDAEQSPAQELNYKPDRTILGLASYACSSVFLASMLTFAKILGKREMPVFEILLARSSSILIIALLVCAKERVNPFGNRQVSTPARSAQVPVKLLLLRKSINEEHLRDRGILFVPQSKQAKQSRAIVILPS